MTATPHQWRIPQRLDAPMRIIFFSTFEVGLLMGAFFIGMLLNHFFLALSIAIGGIILLRRFGSWLDGKSVTVLGYWFLNLGHGKLLPSWQRHWRG